MSKQGSKRSALLLLLGIFVLPLLLAKLVLDLNWYQGGITNRGKLLDSPLTPQWLTELGGSKEGQWRLIYLLPEHCDSACQGALFNLRQVPVAVGAGKDRVDSTVLVAESAQATLSTEIQSHLTGIKLLSIPPHVVAQINTFEFGTKAIYIADPLGNVMMAYPLVSDKTAILAQGKDVLRDLKRLLKVSKIG
ncbi:cytochrome oxidase [Photobacterium sanguinicancri]|uniref:cytochrome oxidase n=1 Tax=Photobacterium sanguinicancri TaxID=875932 RepID=UPI0026E273C5|nr:cytochrome oxidase [Photobacterium sanguinicancri]MDO6499436.1 cytochrome oxidase [Photobacterium sanguinicancri]